MGRIPPGQLPVQPELKEVPVEVTSGVGFHTGQGMIELKIGEHATQMDTKGARALAMILLESAVAADEEAGLVKFWTEIGGDVEDVAAMLHELRRRRAERHKGNVAKTS